jgi:hypothetical protein
LFSDHILAQVLEPAEKTKNCWSTFNQLKKAEVVLLQIIFWQVAETLNFNSYFIGQGTELFSTYLDLYLQAGVMISDLLLSSRPGAGVVFRVYFYVGLFILQVSADSLL